MARTGVDIISLDWTVDIKEASERIPKNIGIQGNIDPKLHETYKIGIPLKGFYKEIFNSDASRYGGSNKGNMGGKFTIDFNIHNYENALDLTLPPLSVSIFKYSPGKSE